MSKKKRNKKRTPPAQAAGPMEISVSPSTMGEVHQLHKKETPVTFNPLDQKFLNPAVIREETLKTLAGIELQIHRLRMIFVANGEDEETVIEDGKKVTDEISRLGKVMEDIQKKFADVLKAPEKTE